MENNNIEFRVCKSCGNKYPISEFNKTARGYSTICNKCLNGTPESNEALAAFKSNELIQELRVRGYKGKLVKTIYKEVVI